MKKYSLLLFILFSITSNSQTYNPFIGTGGHGHTFPGATVPYGMVQFLLIQESMAVGMAVAVIIIPII
jgi:hypothetical protein